MKRIYKFVLFILLATFCQSVFAYDIDISAEALDYHQDDDTISAAGNVKIEWEGRTIVCDFAEFIFEEKLMKARGNVLMTDPAGTIAADNIEYFYDAQKGELIEASIYSESFFSHSKKMERLDEENFSISQMRISNCDLDEPHTYFKAKKATLRTKQRITLYHPVLYVGKIPIFYFPILTKSLKGGKEYGFDFTLEPGYTRDGGLSLKTTFFYGFSESFKSKYFLDYLGAYGLGYGAQFDLSLKGGTIGNIFAYNIYDLIDKKNRYAVRPSFYSNVGGGWIIRSQGEFVSDGDFNRTFDRGNETIILQRPHSYFSVSKNSTAGNLTVLFDRQQNYLNGEFQEGSLSLPKLSYYLYPKTLFWGIKANVTLNYEYGYRNSYDHFFYKNLADLTYSIAKDFRLGRRLTLKPSAGFSFNWYDLDNFEQNDSSAFINYNASVNSRFRVNQWMDWNVNYSARTIGEKNSLSPDIKRNDYGIGTHNVSFNNYMYVGDRTTIRNSMSYDLRNFRNNIAPTRWSPLSTEIIYTPTYNSTIYIRQEEQIEPEAQFKNLQLDITIGDIEILYFNFAVFYQDNRRDEIDNNFGIGLWLNPKWRLDYTLKTTIKTDFSFIDAKRQEFKLYRDLHCYNLGFTVNKTGDDYAVFFKFDLKANMPFDRQKFDKFNYEDPENVFYPWR